jgi:hypothetical protein
MKEVQAFLGFANFYRRFIIGFSAIVRPLTDLTRGNSNDKPHYPLAADSAAAIAFEKLKKAFTVAPVLAHFDPSLETWVEADSSDYVNAAVLSQVHPDGTLRPVAFLSRKMAPAECNYEIYDKELLAIVRAFEEWRPELAGTADPIKVLSDHKALEYFMTTKNLNRRQARWAEFLAEFNFRIVYRPGKQGTKPDSLTRRPGDVPKGITDDRVQHQLQTILTGERLDDDLKSYVARTNLDGGAKHAVHLARLLFDEYEDSAVNLASMMYLMAEELVEGESDDAPPPSLSILDKARQATAEDDVIQQIIHAKLERHRRIPFNLIHGKNIKIELAECDVREGLLYFRNRLFIPFDESLREEIVRQFHETCVTGHGGKRSTYYLVSQHYFWPRMTDTVARFTRNCRTCRRSKPYKEGKHGLLHPLPVPERFWTDISVDFITPLPDCKRAGRTYSHIMVVVDRLSKKQKFIPLETLEVEEVVRAFIEYVWREEGFPSTIVSDRGSQFTSKFWPELCRRLGVKPLLSTAWHPETDGQTEIANAGLKCYLRAYVNFTQNDWVDYLPMAELATNCRENASSGISPALATKGYLPRLGIEPDVPVSPLANRLERLAADDARTMTSRMNDVLKFMKENLVWSQAKMEEYANRSRQPAPEFHVGDRVFLDARNMPSLRTNSGLDFKNLGPYEVTEVIGNHAYRLNLPDCYKNVHDVFHPWLLHTEAQDPLPAQREQKEQDGDLVRTHPDGVGEFYIECIADCRIDKRKKDKLTGEKGLLEYKVKYTNSDDWNASPRWQPYTDLIGCERAVEEFHHDNPDKPGPHRLYRSLAEYNLSDVAGAPAS